MLTNFDYRSISYLVERVTIVVLTIAGVGLIAAALTLF